MRITLTPDIIDFADNVAALRRGQAFLKSRSNGNGLTGSFDKLLEIDRIGARCEAAGKLYLNPIRWNAYAERIHGLADLGHNVDVKGRRKSWHSLIVQKDDEDDFAFLLIDASNHPHYDVIGWLWGIEAKAKEFWADPVGGRAAYFVPMDRLKPPDTLREIVHPAMKESAA